MESTKTEPVAASESETAELIRQMEALGMRVFRASQGNSPYSPEYAVAVPGDEWPERGTRVEHVVLATSHDGKGNYKGRGRTLTVSILRPSPIGNLATCGRGDRGARSLGAGGYVRDWSIHEEDRATGGLGALSGIAASVGLGAPRPPVIVTRHPALVTVLVEDGIVPQGVEVLAHATVNQVRGRRVFGVLPLHLAAEAESITVVDLNLPADLRGQELGVEQVRAHMGGVATYRVTRA